MSIRACKRFLSSAAVAPAVLAMAGLALVDCSSARKKTPELSEMLGKKVALISVDGEDTARKVTEVSLVNQLVQHGSFDLIPKEDVEKARLAPEQDPTDWIGIGRRAGADFALKAKVLEFDATETKGYSTERVEDSQLNEDMGPYAAKDGKTDRLYKVRALTGKIRVQLDFAKTDPKDPDLRTGIAESSESVTSEGKTEAAKLPPRLRFLEQLEGKAFSKFFEEYK